MTQKGSDPRPSPAPPPTVEHILVSGLNAACAVMAGISTVFLLITEGWSTLTFLVGVVALSYHSTLAVAAWRVRPSGDRRGFTFAYSFLLLQGVVYTVTWFHLTAVIVGIDVVRDEDGPRTFLLFLSFLCFILGSVPAASVRRRALRGDLLYRVSIAGPVVMAGAVLLAAIAKELGV